MKKILLLSALAAFTIVANAQKFEVTSVQKVRTSGSEQLYHPVFSPADDNTLFVSDEDYTGLGVVDITAGSYKKLTSFAGAGYRPAISPDGSTVIVRQLHFEDQDMSLFSLDVNTRSSKSLAKKIEHSNTITFSSGRICYSQKGELVAKGVSSRSARAMAAPEVDNLLMTEEDLKLVIYTNGVRRVFDPIMERDGRDLNYCWSSLSPDNTKALFVAGNDAYVASLDGSSLVNLGPMHAPVWRGNDFVVAMEDKDDGHVFTASEIYIVGVDGQNRQQLTTTSEAIKMFPAVSNDGSRVAFHTTDGEIYILTLTEK